jgi:hypothetical protein
VPSISGRVVNGSGLTLLMEISVLETHLRCGRRN